MSQAPKEKKGSLLFLGLLAAGGCEQILGLDGIATYEPGTTTSTSSTAGGGGQSTTSSSGGNGGATMTTGGGATGGVGGTAGSGGSSGGTTSSGGTGGMPLPTSCAKALQGGMSQSGVVMIDPDTESLPEPAIEVYCDQVNMGGGWALVYTSVGDPSGQTTAFWNIPYEQRLEVVNPNGAPSLDKNYYAGRLYKYGIEYRDDIVDTLGVEAIGVVHAKAPSIDQNNMHFMNPVKQQDNLSDDVFYSQFAGGWACAGHDYDMDASDCFATWGVTQHYGGCWYYSLGADLGLTGNPPDHTDGGWGPHISNATLFTINAALAMQAPPKPSLTPVGDPNPGYSTRLQRISRFARW